MNGNDSLAYRLNGSRGQGSAYPLGTARSFFRSPLVHLRNFAFALRRKMQIALDGRYALHPR